MELAVSTEIIWKYFPHFASDQKEKFELLGELYAGWNEKINLLSRKDIPWIYERHVLHSLALLRILQPKRGAVVLDVGTGGGFPGVPLAIALPDAQFHLVDSVGKKVRALTQICQVLKLSNVHIEQSRVEHYQVEVDHIVCRAVARSRQLLQWCKPLMTRANEVEMLQLKGGDLTEEIRELTSWRVKQYAISDWFSEPFFETKSILQITSKD